MDAHDTHCCIVHHCKYGDPDCPIATGRREQQYLCEQCGLETEGYYGVPEHTKEEQQVIIDELFAQKNQKKVIKAPKKAYRDKVLKRLEIVKELFSDRDKVKEMMRRVGGFDKGSDFHNKLEALDILLNRDIPALLEAFEE